MNNTTNTVDITNLSDAALDALLDVKAGAEVVDASKLTVADRYALAAALGWEMNATTRYWCDDFRSDDPRPSRGGVDFEALILAEQEADESRWT